MLVHPRHVLCIGAEYVSFPLPGVMGQLYRPSLVTQRSRVQTSNLQMSSESLVLILSLGLTWGIVNKLFSWVCCVIYFQKKNLLPICVCVCVCVCFFVFDTCFSCFQNVG